MNPEQALLLLDQVAAVASLPRETHIRVQEAVGVLRKLIEDNAAEKAIKG